MPVSAESLEFVRKRADYRCEYCGVTEHDSGGLLTVDHYRPISAGGVDEPSNLVYACFRCNNYKRDYWPVDASDVTLANPRVDQMNDHIVALDDGSVAAISAIGAATIFRLKLNRTELIENRLIHMRRRIVVTGAQRISEISARLIILQSEQSALLLEQAELFDEQNKLLRVTVRDD